MSQSKADQAEQTRQNLPLPDQPPTASDWQSADARNVNVGSGRVSTADGGADRGSGAADLSGVGRQGKDGLKGPPKDAAAR
ncbi:hypothetical protein QBC33DRAFT_226082 [Phialemonium atrogriseum]|uniref:Uncharacterized protein n=1 Tax=Phialemonium atrogriseum TaxID=1093897 RepID=A0AAJ0C7L7_9PEZI|nr:uncharacterized protein QBC33DRAFT_226082 [Phialemonium atrogriseum]KAK1771002.1 hypothetical protein QBC33DRAFT_226082 [Phialemonium atrogriseum]